MRTCLYNMHTCLYIMHTSLYNMRTCVLVCAAVHTQNPRSYLTASLIYTSIANNFQVGSLFTISLVPLAGVDKVEMGDKLVSIYTGSV